jgi:hypothetical protein
MKRIYILIMATFLFSGAGFANDGGGKGKEKPKKSQSSGTKSNCPGKTCGKKKA